LRSSVFKKWLFMRNYFKRDIIDDVIKYIDDKNVVVIHGARQVGKTTLLKIIIDKLKKNISDENIFYIDLEDLDLLETANKGVQNFINYLNGFKYNKNYKRYLFIDEIQYLKNPTNFLKLFVDHHSDKFKLIVSGSSSFEIKSKFKDSLVGRTVNFELFGLSFNEYLNFKNKNYDLNNISDNELLNNELKELFSDYVLYSNYPAIVLEDVLEKKEKYLKQIISTYIKKDIKDLANIKNITKFNNLLRILAEQTGALLNVSTLSNSIDLTRQTIDDYLMLMENTYITKKVYPYFNNVKTELVKMPKIFFEDTGLMNLLNYREFISKITGEMLENAIYTILRRIVANENIYFWRTKKQQEIDFVIKRRKQMILFEVKLRYSGQSLNNLLYFMNKYKNNKAYIVTLEKNIIPQKENIDILYPWEINKIL
jgi:uncharacterized protein